MAKLTKLNSCWHGRSLDFEQTRETEKIRGNESRRKIYFSCRKWSRRFTSDDQVYIRDIILESRKNIATRRSSYVTFG